MRPALAQLLFLVAWQAGCTQLDSEPASGGGGAGGAGGFAGASAQVKQWAEEVALGTEFGSAENVVSRFTSSPTLSVIAGSTADRAHLDELVPVLNQELGAAPIEVVGDADPNADISVYFVLFSEFDAIGQANGFQVVPGNWGYFHMFWDKNHALTKTYVLLATDKLAGAELRHFTFEEVTQSLGLATDSAIFPDSIFYANGFDGGDATELSALDRRLLRFLYAHTQPGDGPVEFQASFDAYF